MLVRKLGRVVCGMSGGVDSSVAAYLLKKKGYDVVGVFMRNWDSRDAGERCVLDAEESDAQFVCDHLKIPMKTVDFVKTYWHSVFSTMLDEYQMGWTPNPDMLCNRAVKFGVFHEYATRRLGADLVATGHYARLHPLPDGRVRLMQGVDAVKDQSFFLAQVKQEALQRSLFPLGDLEKATVKQIAENIGLHKIATKKESMGLCFIGKRDFRAFVEQYLEPRPGSFVDMETGKVVGTHTGVHSWTVGQRCNIGGCPVAYYVARLCHRTQRISVVPGQHHPALYWRTLYTDKPHWICRKPPLQVTGDAAPTLRCLFRTQHRNSLAWCVAVLNGDTKAATGAAEWPHIGGLKVTLDDHHRAIAIGQFIVLYGEDGECYGSAKILGLGPSHYDEQKQAVEPCPPHRASAAES
ncbi:mitochondrial tRNA-specific 2-thiouridylase 1 [Rhipicephalus sanguineus]|uniref:mitochondrial tRNA-specific 2-thiouridylase 1 n=1 Tax=Rhipicephalus sanguineus TaxID=34632 RepID=UPI001893907E|nr:mitochondrial tRNA-specific 2-thiouridylase 1 [Rhipicephalus sanguineus]